MRQTPSGQAASSSVQAPKFVKTGQWDGYENVVWPKKAKKDVTILFSFVERRKSLFLGAFFKRKKYRYLDMGDHIKEDVRWGKEYGNRMECNPMYFTSGILLRHLFKLQKETGLSKEEIVKKYIYLGGGGQCGPCRYGMYPQEYMKAVNDAGFKNFRIMIFSSDILQKVPKDSALKFDLTFKINILIAAILADLMHIAECALRPYAENKEEALRTIERAEELLFRAFESKRYLFAIPRALRQAGRLFAAIKRKPLSLPKIYFTGEIFANFAHNDGNYNLRRFIMDEMCEVYPGIFTQRLLYDNWRREREGERGCAYAPSRREYRFQKSTLRRQRLSSAVIRFFYYAYVKALAPRTFGGRTEILDLDQLAKLGFDYYHPEIFGGEGNMEIAEAIYYADKLDGFISSKPFGCMPSSGVSDGVQSKIMAMHPSLNFLSIETSGDNEVNILSRVSMLLFKAKQKALSRGPTQDA